MHQDQPDKEPVTEPLPDDIHPAENAVEDDQTVEKPSFVEGAGTG